MPPAVSSDIDAASRPASPARRPRRHARRARIVAGSFVALAAVAFALHLVGSRVPDSGGLSAVFFVPFTMPWLALVPDAWVASPSWSRLVWPASWACVGVNAAILYALVGDAGRRPPA